MGHKPAHVYRSTYDFFLRRTTGRPRSGALGSSRSARHRPHRADSCSVRRLQTAHVVVLVIDTPPAPEFSFPVVPTIGSRKAAMPSC